MTSGLQIRGLSCIQQAGQDKRQQGLPHTKGDHLNIAQSVLEWTFTGQTRLEDNSLNIVGESDQSSYVFYKENFCGELKS